MTTTILAVMAKNEEANLLRCLSSVEGVVDKMLVADSGSEDNTRTLARDFGAEVLNTEWVGYAHNRTQLLGWAAERADRILWLDADMTFEGELPPGHRRDCWRAMLRYDGIEYLMPFLLRSGLPWEYRGVTHEALYCAEKFTMEDTDLFAVTHHGGKRANLEQDLELLLEAGTGDTRNLFYYAQTLRDLGRVDEAIEAYLARAELGGYDEEKWYSLYQAGCLLCVHHSFAEGAKVLLRAYDMRPHRAEPLRALATSGMNVADKLPWPDGDGLFIEPSAYADAMDGAEPAAGLDDAADEVVHDDGKGA